MLELTGIIAWSEVASEVLIKGFTPATKSFDWDKIDEIIKFMADDVDWDKQGEYRGMTGEVGGRRMAAATIYIVLLPMIEQIDDQKIILGLTEVVAEFLSENLPPTGGERHLAPHVPERLKRQITRPSDLLKYDLYCNLRVLIGNDRFFRDCELIADGTVQNCARIALAYRNRMAHKNLDEVILLEQMQLEYMSISRIVSLLPTSTEMQAKVEELRTYIGSVLVFLAKEYFNTELSSQKKIELRLRSNNPLDIEEYEDDEFNEKVIRLSISECKSQLRRLREDIQQSIPDMPKFRNILRESILDSFTSEKIIDLESFRKSLPPREYAKTDERQFVHFDKIAEIVNRL